MLGIKDKFPDLPERISGLRELAYNLWWSWHPEGRAIFKLLNRTGWYLSNHNPVKMLNQIGKEALESASKDPHFLRHYDSVMARFESYMDVSSGWFCANVTDPKRYTIAYFSAEYGLHHALPFYAGGLGFLAGDYLKECSDLGIPLVGVGFMYPQGYLRQRISPDGWQVGACELLDRENAPIRRVLDEKGDPLSVKVPIGNPPIYLDIWKVQVGKTDLYLIDTSGEANDPWNRSISDRLYTGDPELRLRQEIVLGIGGIRVLQALGVDYSLLHLNEGHPAFAILERIREKVEKGMTYRDAFEAVRSRTVFTTHTPVPAGHDVFTFQLMDKYFGSYLPTLETDRDAFFSLGTNPANPSGFNMTAFALRSSAYRNAVSKKHGEVTRRMWRQLWPDMPEDKAPIDYITNGVHVPSWIDRRLGDVIFNHYLGRGWLEEHDEPRIWELIDEIPDEVLWNHHVAMKNLLVGKIRERAREKWLDSSRADPRLVMSSGVLLDSPVLTLGFARRFASYKRPTLLLQDMERLKEILTDTWRPVQIIFAGKAHQDDQQSKQLLQQVFNAAHDSSFGGRIAFVEDYDELLAQYLVHGVDVWVNNPLPPMEASGTSGMKATLNGVPQLSILDGWWIEGYNGSNGWAVQGAEGQDRDARDADAIYDILEKEIVPLYYDVDERGVPHGWVKIMKETTKMTGPNFSARRMAKEYSEKFYRRAIEGALRAEYTADKQEVKADLFGNV
jgi:starch phosphorylase